MTDRTDTTAGKIIESFRLPASTGHTLDLDSFRGKVSIVLVFLDRRSESHLRLLEEIDTRSKEFGEERSQILVVMSVTADEARQMAEEGEFTVPLLADANGGMADDFDVEIEEDGYRATAVVADEDARLVRRFDPLLRDDEWHGVVDDLLDAVRSAEPDDRPPQSSLSDEDAAFFADVAEQTNIPDEEAPSVVYAFLRALAPFLSEEARLVVNELTPEGMVVEDHEDTVAADRDDISIESLLMETVGEVAIAAGHPVDHARVVAEALRNRADASQLDRLRRSLENEDVLSLFESTRGELTAGEPLEGAEKISGKD